MYDVVQYTHSGMTGGQGQRVRKSLEETIDKDFPNLMKDRTSESLDVRYLSFYRDCEV